MSIVELMGNSMHKELVLKGGLAMRAVHGSVRFTKDIDLDSDLRHSKTRVQAIVKQSIDRAISSGLICNAVVTTPKQTDTTLRWKILGTQPGSDAPMNLTVEISRRASVVNGHVIDVPLSDAFASGPSINIQVLDSQAIAVTKIMALTSPQRMAPRDLYDLYVLISANVADPSHLLAGMPDSKVKLPLAMAELWPKIEAMDFALFRTEVMPYLPQAVASSIGESEFDEMRLGVGEKVEKWLQAASEISIRPSSVGGSILFGTPGIAGTTGIAGAPANPVDTPTAIDSKNQSSRNHQATKRGPTP